MERPSSRLMLPLLALLAAGFAIYSSYFAPEAGAEKPADTQGGARATANEGSVRAAPAPTLALKDEHLALAVASDNAALRHAVLLDPRYQRDGKQIDLVTTDKADFLPLRLTLVGSKSPLLFSEAKALDGNSARFVARQGDLEIVRKLELTGGPFQLWSTVRITNRGSTTQKVQLQIEAHHYVRRADEQGGMFAARSPLTAGAMCLANAEPHRYDRKDTVEEPHDHGTKVSFGALDDVYFTQAIAANGAPFENCRISGDDRPSPNEPDGSLLSVALKHPAQTLAPGQSVVLRTLAYLGPKSPHMLEQAGHDLTRATYAGGMWGIDSISRGLVGILEAIHSRVANWGLAIILLTLLVKIVLYPLTAKSFESMAAMRKLKPEIDALNEKYGNDREKKGAAMMELYKKHKINPLGGCLPQLFQLPIWWGLYSSLSTNVELFHRPFALFWTDLTAADPYYILPLALGALMFVQQKLTPNTMDAVQAKMMLYMMPTMITAFMLFLPAGLCLYMFTNSLLSIAQQKFIEYRQRPVG